MQGACSGGRTMVDWGLGGGRELHVARMHAADRHQRPDTRLPPTSDMSREDEMEFNALDFVETEYKVETCDASEQGKKQKKGRPRSQGRQGKTGNKRKPKENAKGPGKGGRTTYKRRKRKRSNKQTDESVSTGSVAQYYPYAALLKNLCDKVGNSEGSPEALPNRIFSQLRPSDVHYPYASLLQALHRHAGVNARRASGPSRGRASLEVARVMRKIHYPTSSRVGGEEDGSPLMLCSTELMVLAMQEKVHRHDSNPGIKCSIGGIGEILRKQMPQSQRDDPPPSELSSASLLQKLSLSAERDLGVTGNRHGLSGVHQGGVWSSESSHSEEDDLDWRPTHWQAKKVSRDPAAPINRKSVRKKNFMSWDLEQEQPNTSQGVRGAGRGRQQRGTVSESARAKLLQFIMGRRQGAPTEKRSKKTVKRTKVTKKRGKRKHTNNTENTPDWTTKLPTGDLTKDCTTPSKGASGRRTAGETQSLLKEYLLKPAGEEVVPSENCDIPKLETNFLFSRLLQNFKSLVESSQPDQPSDGPAESCRGPSILRGMLSAGAAVDEPKERLSPGNHQSASLSSLGQQRKRQARSPPHVKEPPVTVKVEPEVVVECLEEEIVCKEECEEDGYECHVCHLQFSSLTDLSNHQVLFHCAEEPTTPTGSHRLLGCSVEGLAGGVMQGKQPA